MRSLRWQDSAECAQIGSDLFFQDEDSPYGNYRHARKICKVCPVRLDCLEYALADRIPHGMWGGLTPKERQSLLRGAA